MEKMKSLQKAQLAANALDSKKARDIKILKVAEKTVIADYFVISEGTSNTQIKALCDEVEYQLDNAGISCTNKEGHASATWIIMDYDDVIVHIFDKEARKYYNLEKLWADAEEVE